MQYQYDFAVFYGLIRKEYNLGIFLNFKEPLLDISLKTSVYLSKEVF